YKEYYAIASGKVPPKTKASVHKKKADYDTTPKEKPPTDPKDKRVKQTGKMTSSGKQKQPAIDYQTTDESEKQKDDDMVQDGEEDKEGDATNVNMEGGDVDMTDADTTKDTEDAHVTLTAATPVVQQQSLSVSDLVSKFISPTTDEAISSIPGIVNEYFGSKMKEAVDVAIQLKSNKLREEAQAENQEFLNSLDSNMQKIIKDQVKTQTSKIKSKVKKRVTESLGAEVLIRSTNQPQTSYKIASSLSELELKRILMDKIEENKSIDRSDVQKNLYNALVEAYNTNEDLLSSYGDVLIIPRTRDDKYKDEEPSAGSNQGTKRWRSGKEAKLSKEPTRKKSRTTSSSKVSSRS
ncbi:hypothetical protein Tco_1273731, partial [Tanacetum coccineum]